MKYIIPIFQSLFILIVSFLAPIIIPLSLVFAKWDSNETIQDNIKSTYGDLPPWASWFSTPDARLPGGLYEPTVLKMLNSVGPFITSWYWLGIRNRAHGLAAKFSKPATVEQFNAPENFGFKDYGNGIWQYRTDFLFFTIKVGYRVYDLRNGSYIASPCVAIRFS